MHRYAAADDREVVGLVASSLAFGRVQQILGSVERVLERLGGPSAALERMAASRRALRGFRHRFVAGEEVADLLEGAARVRRRWGTLHAYFVRRCYDPALRAGEGMPGAASRFARGLLPARPSYLLPDPARGSACKRLHLYLRWMVRHDRIDLGPWTGVRPEDLVVPMDTHMHRICLRLGLTRRRRADAKAALEATGSFRALRPDDPVRYDFALTRIGMSGALEDLPRPA